jgi:hypothetical protein
MEKPSIRSARLRRPRFHRCITAFAAVALSCNQAFCEERPRLQILNGSPQTIDVFWMKSENERVSN